MIRAADPLLTVADLDRLPADAQRHALRHGHLVTEPPPGFDHGRVAVRVVCALDAWCLAQAAGVVVTCDVGFVLARDPDTVLAPDVAFLSNATLRRIVDVTHRVPGPPDLAVEVVSPTDRARLLRDKVGDWLGAGAERVWLVDPQRRTVRVFGGGHETTWAQHHILTDEALLPGFRLPLENVFGWRL